MSHQNPIQLFSPLKEIIEEIHERFTAMNLEISNLELRIAELESRAEEFDKKQEQLDKELDFQV